MESLGECYAKGFANKSANLINGHKGTPYV